MKVLAYFAIPLIIILLLMGVIAVENTPTYIYNYQLEQYSKTENFKAILSGSERENYSFLNAREEPIQYWNNVHWKDFSIRVPVRHPIYNFSPYFDLYDSKTGPDWGFSIQSRLKGEEFRLVYRGIKNIDKEIGESMILNLPLFKRFLHEKELSTVMHDIFSLNIQRAPYHFLSFDKFKLKHWQEMAYKVFILKERIRFFKGYSVNKVSWLSGPHTGEVELTKLNEVDLKKYNAHIYFIYNNDSFFMLEVLDRKFSIYAESISREILTQISIKLSTKDDGIKEYNEYQNTPFSEKLTTAGMGLFYSAWSHRPLENNFLEQLVPLLEKGYESSLSNQDKVQADINDEVLQKVYKYGIEKFGSAYSNRIDDAKSNFMAKIRKNKMQEIKDEIKKLRDKEDDLPIVKKEDETETIKTKLIKAKQNVIEEKGVLRRD